VKRWERGGLSAPHYARLTKGEQGGLCAEGITHLRRITPLCAEGITHLREKHHSAQRGITHLRRETSLRRRE